MRTIILFILVFLFACAGGDANTDLFEPDAGATGTATQAYSIKKDPSNFAWGVKADADYNACKSDGPTSQVCHFLKETAIAGQFPEGISMRIRIDSSIVSGSSMSTNAIVNEFCANVGTIVNTPPGAYPWSCQIVTSGENIYLKNDTTTAPANSLRKSEYIAPGFGGCTTLLPGAVPSNGTYKVCTGVTVFFREASLFNMTNLAPVWTADQRLRAYKDVIKHGLLEAAGHGSISTHPNGSFILAQYLGARTAGNPGFLDSRSSCRMRSISILNADQFFFGLQSTGTCS